MQKYSHLFGQSACFSLAVTDNRTAETLKDHLRLKDHLHFQPILCCLFLLCISLVLILPAAYSRYVFSLFCIVLAMCGI